MVQLGDLMGFFQPWWLYDFVILSGIKQWETQKKKKKEYIYFKKDPHDPLHSASSD